MDQNIKTLSNDLFSTDAIEQDKPAQLNSEAEEIDVSIEIELENVKTSYSFGEARPY
jgi:hypothetical protein